VTQVQTLDQIIDMLLKNKEKIRGFGVESLGIFGSFIHGKQTSDSDVDIMVEFAKGQKSFRNFMALVYYLETLLGRKVELVTTESLSPYLKHYILEKIEYVKVA